MRRRSSVFFALLLLTGLVAGTVGAQLKINEVYFNVTPQSGNQYVELLNVGPTNAYLDGMVLTDEAGAGTEGVYRFPGLPGGTTLPVAAGARVVVAVDATGDTAVVDWECYAGGGDSDNPSVPNLSKVSGSDELSFFSGGDNCLLATGTDTSAPIDLVTIVDGVNFGDGGGELAPLSAAAGDAAPVTAVSYGFCIGRCQDGADHDYASNDDFFPAVLNRGASNICALPTLSVSDASVREGNFGLTSATFRITMNMLSSSTVTVFVITSDGTAVGDDYVPLTGTKVVFLPGVTSMTTTATARGDFFAETSEVFYVRLVSQTNASLQDATGDFTIQDDDTGVVVFCSIAGSETAITSVWTTVSGHTYRVESPTDWRSGIWTNVGGVITAVDVFTELVDTSITGGMPIIYRVLKLD